MNDHLINVGILPCMAKNTCESRTVYTRFVPITDIKIKYETDDSSSDYTDDDESETDSDVVSDPSTPTKKKYAIVAAAISKYVADIKGL